jgi:GDP-D-mannose 3',5'-epimerase
MRVSVRGGGFIGGHLVKRLKRDGLWVRGVDLKFHEFSKTEADDFVLGDLRNQGFCRATISTFSLRPLVAKFASTATLLSSERTVAPVEAATSVNLPDPLPGSIRI